MRDARSHSLSSTPRATSRGRVPVGTVALALVGLLASVLAGCGDESAGQSPSLDGPQAITNAFRSQCGDGHPALRDFVDTNRRCNIGLIANANTDRLAITDLGRKSLRLDDLDPSTPGTTHLPVGKRPVDVESGPDGTVAYTLNSVSNDLSVVDLWRLEVADDISLPETPRDLATGPSTNDGGQLAVALADPDQLWLRRGIHCRRPDANNPGCTSPNATPTTRSLPGRPSAVTIGPRGRQAYVVYQNRRYLSVFALADEVVDANSRFECRRGRNAAPCEIRRVGLTYGCSDGVDSDGDGLADQRDPQCWGPRGAESSDGIGRAPQRACNDGVDNDGDGLADREDPDCQAASDDSEASPLDPDASFTCSNGADDDGDGAADAPNDSDCYGEHGRTEQPVERTGFASVDVDRMGTFVYVVDRADGQLLTVDANRLELIDAGTARDESSAPFENAVGVPVGARPTSAVGVVGREVEWRDPDTDGRGIVNYSFGAYVVSDNGRTYFVEAVDSQCEVREARRNNLLPNRKFRIGSDAFQTSSERSCLTMPELPVDKDNISGNPVDACEQVRACLTCAQSSNFRSCDAKCNDLSRNRLECQGAGREFDPSNRTRLVVNPKFTVADSRARPGRITTRGQCTAPRPYRTRLRNDIDDNPDAPETFTCNSPLRPQPLTPTADDPELDGDSYEDIPHAALLRNAILDMEAPDDGGGSVDTSLQSRAADIRYRNETWSVVWEGRLPGTNRNDGLPAQSTRTVDDGDETTTVADFDPGNIDLCRSGVRAGDRLVLRSKPKSGDDAPERCSQFRTSEDNQQSTDADNRDPYRTYRIASVRPDRLVLETLDRPVEGQEYADVLPTRECFPKGVSYAIRAENAWIVRGSESGFISGRTSELGRCVERYDADTERVGGRVESGGLYVGPYFSFYLHDGDVPPLRRPDEPYRYRFSVRRFYDPRTFNIENASLPSDILLARRANRGVKLLVSDVSGNFVWFRNFRSSKNKRLR